MENTVDIIKLHEQKMDFLENRRNVKLPETKEQVSAFEAVLRNEFELTDAMANAVFKDHRLLKNARMREKQRRKMDKSSVNLEYTEISDDAYERIQQQAKLHTNRLRRLKGKSASKLTTDEINEIKSFIAKKKEWIREVESDEEYMSYVFAASKMIDEYKEELKKVQEYEKDQNESMQVQAIRDAKRQKCEPLAIEHHNTVTDLIIHENVEQACTDLEVAVSHAEIKNNNIMNWVPESDIYVHLSEIQADYFEFIGEPDPTGYRLKKAFDQSELDIYCQECHVEFIIDVTHAEKSCPQCGQVFKWVDNSLKTVPFGDSINPPKSRATYERKTYYEKWKKQVSGALNSSITDEDWAIIFKECTERQWETVDKVMIRKLLKQMNMSDYYDLVPVITNELNGIPLVKFSPEEEAALDEMFDEAQDIFERCPWEVKQRTNYISYAYHFYQCCRMLGYNHYLPAFSLLVGEGNLKHHDRIWKWMCEHKEGEPKWEFMPTF